MKSFKYGLLVLTFSFLLIAVPRTRADVSLVSTGSVWKYFDGGFEPANWKRLLFDDSGWPMGPGQLGFGDGDEATIVSRTNSTGATNITFYFRRKFNLPDPSGLTNLMVRLRRDDGAVVWINEVEVFRSNMPPGPVDYSTLASTAAADDGNSFFANAVPASLLLNGDNILAVEIHQNAVTSSDISFDLELLGNVSFQPPTVALTAPANGSLIGSSNLILNATAADVDGVVTSVEFFIGNTLFAVDTNAPFSVTNFNIADGTYPLTAVAIDSTGLSATSAPVTVRVVPRIVPSGAGWRYLDDGSNQGTAWREPAFDDSVWPSGPAQLGFGDGDEATLLTGTTAVTYYFRHWFSVPSVAGISNLVLRVLRDDGVIVYLNGAEVFRNNMPAGTVTYTTLASSAIDDNRFHATQVTPSRLLQGDNVLAVEIHQGSLTSSDISFDLELLPNVPPTPPVVALTAPTNNAVFYGPTNVGLTTATSDRDDLVASTAFYANGRLLGTDLTDPFSLTATNLAVGPHTLWAVATDQRGMSTTSAPVNITILAPPIVTTLISTGATWRYLDTGVDQGTAWRARTFDDAGWPSGAGILGSGQLGTTTLMLPVTTTINIAPINVNITAYFRHHFVVANAGSYTNLAFGVLRDDGVVAYLNGTEIFRMNMPTGTVFFSTAVPSAQAVGGTNEIHYFPTNISPGLVVEGANVLAVELHQTMNTTDAGFDLSMLGIAPPSSPVPRIAIEYRAEPTAAVILTWPGAGSVLQQATSVQGPFTDVAGAASPHSVAPSGAARFFRLRSQ